MELNTFHFLIWYAVGAALLTCFLNLLTCFAPLGFYRVLEHALFVSIFLYILDMGGRGSCAGVHFAWDEDFAFLSKMLDKG